jgi:hemolysin III
LIALVALRGPLGWSIFGAVWGLSIVGIVFKVFWVKKFVILSTILYISMGWVIVFAIKPIMSAMTSAGIIFLVLGGVLYTVGTIFYVWRKIRYHHAVWHLFVLGGSICHFFTVLLLLQTK